jgi:hypothetical protein
MLRLDDDSDIFFRGDVVSGLKLDGVTLSPPRCINGDVSSIQKVEYS